jgi:hypothetical protein
MLIRSVGLTWQDDLHVSLCQVGRGFPVALQRAPGCSTEHVHLSAIMPLGAVPARNAEPDIHLLYQVDWTVTED